MTPEWLLRLLAEQTELSEKVQKLNMFIHGSTEYKDLDAVTQSLLLTQYYQMLALRETLRLRIDHARKVN